ncbi:2-amino-4-hydroxy-6-hydroxymethyldihydropteridine pyrophosphokinase [Sulfobacillus acidophilus TPY]|nr:2-amino-4-hydroxy-6-hydroxymethyldihydropteridine pyrophosphokinase [Sulfobacillus acidophilus TPY]
MGSNLGDSHGLLKRAAEAVLAQDPTARFSSLYRTAPQGGPPQPDYLNAVVQWETDWDLPTLWAFCRGLEAEAGRVRTVRFGPRTLDVDILCYGRHLTEKPPVILPHPRMKDRRFVLEPLTEIDPECRVPPDDTPVLTLLRRVLNQEVQRLPPWEVFPRNTGRSSNS